MDILERIVEAVAQKLISLRLNEEGEQKEDPMDNARGDLLRKKLADRNFKKAIGNNNRRSTLGSSAKGSPEYKARMHAGSTSSGTPIEQINQMGVRKTHNTATNDAAERALAAKTRAIGNKVMGGLKNVRD